MNNIKLGKLIDKGILSTVYECKYKNKNYIIKIEYVTKDDIINKNSQKQKEVEFSLKFGNKHSDYFMELIDYYFQENCTIQLRWDLNNPPKTWYKKLINEYKSIMNQFTIIGFIIFLKYILSFVTFQYILCHHS